MFCSKRTSHRISHLRLRLPCDIDLRNPSSQNKSSALENSDMMLVSWYHASCLIIDIIACKDQRENVQIIDIMDLKHWFRTSNSHYTRLASSNKHSAYRVWPLCKPNRFTGADLRQSTGSDQKLDCCASRTVSQMDMFVKVPGSDQTRLIMFSSEHSNIIT